MTRPCHLLHLPLKRVGNRSDFNGRSDKFAPNCSLSAKRNRVCQRFQEERLIKPQIAPFLVPRNVSGLPSMVRSRNSLIHRVPVPMTRAARLGPIPAFPIRSRFVAWPVFGPGTQVPPERWSPVGHAAPGSAGRRALSRRSEVRTDEPIEAAYASTRLNARNRMIAIRKAQDRYTAIMGAPNETI